MNNEYGIWTLILCTNNDQIKLVRANIYAIIGDRMHWHGIMTFINFNFKWQIIYTVQILVCFIIVWRLKLLSSDGWCKCWEILFVSVRYYGLINNRHYCCGARGNMKHQYCTSWATSTIMGFVSIVV